METTKVCFKCKKEKPLSEFYKHKAMGDGYLGKCKECTKNDVKVKYVENIQNDDYIEKERARGREKYKRLKYSERTQYKKPYSRGTRSIHKFFKKLDINLDGKELHHWNYTLKYDVFILNIRAHKLIHKTIKYNEILNCFETLEGIVLNTKKLHYEYILNVFKEHNVNYEIEVYPF